MPLHKEALGEINHKSSITDKLKALHHVARQHNPQISRIAVALYAQDTDLLKTFIDSS
jgi:hypothetical protein